MTKRPLALTDAQLAQVKQAASTMPTPWRDGFLRAIARRLAGVPNPTNDDVSGAIIAVLGGLGIDPMSCCGEPQEAPNGPAR